MAQSRIINIGDIVLLDHMKLDFSPDEFMPTRKTKDGT